VVPVDHNQTTGGTTMAIDNDKQQKENGRMDIIMLRGSNSCGKTTTLNMVYSMLLVNHTQSTNKQPLGGNKSDFSDIVNYKGRKIAFFTMGDYSLHIVNAMTNYANQGADILVCACNSKFVKPFKVIQQYPHTIIDKTVASAPISQQSANMFDAQQLLALIEILSDACTIH
jgi:hypothetical protein